MAYHMGPAMGVKLGEDRRVPHCTVGNPVCLYLEKQFEGARALPRRRVSPSAFFDDLGGYCFPQLELVSFPQPWPWLDEHSPTSLQLY